MLSVPSDESGGEFVLRTAAHYPDLNLHQTLGFSVRAQLEQILFMEDLACCQKGPNW